ncbi:putative cyclic-di-GMP phosphodiesterase AdrB [Pseudobythopirellula maris]|uniref:Putative cyclic-di-GMP phosphodiesterase AdrB n=1 Tax=Pseudobythopirellula maris TaxID=2527991 RepID=A0A5C5ZIC9_9BACT|nr:EAL domain-containing protein [Pseudobythopirellula maris]TWT86900.1 putative cyclic-di-GMP phosphodiesterase AdrB [Pseudobythopirellula maris]
MIESPSQVDTELWQLSGQLADDDVVRNFVIDHSPYSVGRTPEANLSIPCPTVSNAHAEFEYDNASLLVRDLGSTNGTFVNGVRITGECSLNPGDLVQFARVVLRVARQATVRHNMTVENDSSDRALSLIQFDKLMTERAVVPFFQPIVSMEDLTVIGYEILGRSRLFGLKDPQTMFGVAAALKLESELSRIFRDEGLKVGDILPGNMLLFANTHPAEIDEPELLKFSLRELRERSPARPLVLEIHEATATQTESMRELRAALDDLNIGLAYDDFGAGQARLVELVEVPPDYLKFDIKLVRDIRLASMERQKMVERLVQMTTELGIIPLAEGIEHAGDHKVCEQMGFVTGQGYLYGRPAAVGTYLH